MHKLMIQAKISYKVQTTVNGILFAQPIYLAAQKQTTCTITGT